MATITLTLQVSQTVSTLDAATIAGVIAWVQTNILSKLPANATATTSFNIVP